MPKSEAAPTPASVLLPVPSHASRLGPSLQFQGALSGAEDLVIQGVFRGRIVLLNRTLHIDLKAEVEAEIEAGDVYIAGALNGNIRATGRVVLAASARVNCDIAAAQISIQDGACFKGAVQMKKG